MRVVCRCVCTGILKDYGQKNSECFFFCVKDKKKGEKKTGESEKHDLLHCLSEG